MLRTVQAASCFHALGKQRVGQQPIERCGKRLWVVRRHHKASTDLRHPQVDCGPGSGHHRQPQRQRPGHGGDAERMLAAVMGYYHAGGTRLRRSQVFIEPIILAALMRRDPGNGSAATTLVCIDKAHIREAGLTECTIE